MKDNHKNMLIKNKFDKKGLHVVNGYFGQSPVRVFVRFAEKFYLVCWLSSSLSSNNLTLRVRDPEQLGG